MGCLEPMDADRELEEIIRWSLKSHMRGEAPPDRVWQKIQASLDGGPLAFPDGRRRSARLPRVMQLMSVAAAFLLFAGVLLVLDTSSTMMPQPEWRVTQTSLQPSAPVVLSRDDVQSSRLAYLARQEQLIVQRSLSPSQDPVLVYRLPRG